MNLVNNRFVSAHHGAELEIYTVVTVLDAANISIRNVTFENATAALDIANAEVDRPQKYTFLIFNGRRI